VVSGVFTCWPISWSLSITFLWIHTTKHILDSLFRTLWIPWGC
jgi:hypothetical protein